jgi:gamma-glutamyltranspeptidase/glutathione hydrolase
MTFHVTWAMEPSSAACGHDALDRRSGVGDRVDTPGRLPGVMMMSTQSAARAGLVAAGHPAVAAAASEILDAGGNAFDAAVAAGFAAAVAEPALTSLAGGGFLLARTADGTATFFDFFVDTPGLGADRAVEPHFTEVVVAFAAADQSFHCGPGSVAVPGVLDGYVHVHRRLGRLELAQVVAPARRLAIDGVPLGPAQSSVVALLESILLRTAEGRALFAPRGALLQNGDRFYNPDFARTLDAIAAGAIAAFADAPVAAPLIEAMRSGNGLITATDLAAYRVRERAPLSVPIGADTLLTAPAPSFGGRLLDAMIQRIWPSDTSHGAVDPVEFAQRFLGASIDIENDRAVLLAADPARPICERGTTHISVCDAEGNVAAMTTSNGECSGDVIDGTGILCNNMLGEDDLHPDGIPSLRPTRGAGGVDDVALVRASAPSGTAELALGSGGSKRIRSAVLQVLTAVVDHHVELTAAVDAPRLHWDTDHTEVEPGFGAEVLAALGTAGPVNEWPGPSVYFGGVHAVAPGAGSPGSAGADPRRDGAIGRSTPADTGEQA